MLEVINGFLLVYFVVLCILSIFVPQIVKPLAACFAKPSGEEQAIWAEILKLKAEQKEISMKDEFAAYSKLQRRINTLETKFKDNSQSRRNKGFAVKSSIHIILQAAIAVLIVVSVLWYRREPIVVLKGNLFPFTSMLKYPSEMPNSISCHVWVIISNVSVRCLLKPLLI